MKEKNNNAVTSVTRNKVMGFVLGGGGGAAMGFFLAGVPGSVAVTVVGALGGVSLATVVDVMGENAILTVKNGQQAERIGGLEGQVATLNAEKQEQAQEIVTLKGQVGRLNADNDLKAEQIAGLQGEVKRLNADNDLKTGQLADITEDNRIKTGQIAYLQEEIERLQSNIAGLEAGRQEQEDRIFSQLLAKLAEQRSSRSPSNRSVSSARSEGSIEIAIPGIHHANSDESISSKGSDHSWDMMEGTREEEKQKSVQSPSWVSRVRGSVASSSIIDELPLSHSSYAEGQEEAANANSASTSSQGRQSKSMNTEEKPQLSLQR